MEIAALILTVAVIAAVVLTLRHRQGVKRQNPGEQARTMAGDRLRMVKMPAEATRRTLNVPADGQAPAGEDKP